MANAVIGAVGTLWRYPVKSMLGEQLPAAEVTEHGLDGDRRLALVDRETGRIASAKTPRLWHRLLSCTATGEGHGVRITARDGKSLWSTDAGIDDALSAIAGRPVTLADRPPEQATLERSKPDQVLSQGPDAAVEADIVPFGSAAPSGTFFDYAPLHLISTSTLRRIAELHPDGVSEVRRYRPNIVVNTDAPGFTEHDWFNRELRIGDRLTLRVVANTPRCAVPTLAHGPLPRDTGALRTLAEHNRHPALPGLNPEPCAGIYARVLQPGRIRPGDTVQF
ncbi:MOSC domain-containing protein [Streptacidiphilus sp. EB103A]|uniref:MOSC domain-containing protein n=1 Tax=Streptacidiphilus sp. EB103A TaxID=3156275 RepID=UPI00351455A6